MARGRHTGRYDVEGREMEWLGMCGMFVMWGSGECSEVCAEFGVQFK